MTLKEANFELSKTENQLEYYQNEKKRLEKAINDLNKRRNNLDTYILKELKRLEEYDKMEQLIIYYKDEYKKKLTWLQIVRRPGIYCSVRQAQRIYEKYKSERDTN